MDQHSIAATGIAARIAAHGAELQSLQDPAGHEFLWQAGPEWSRHAPVLFPIVGRLTGDTLRHNGHAYRLTQHGFARDSHFAWMERTPTFCRLALTDTPETLARYPFPFRFEVAYAAAGDTLAITYTIENPGPTILPASMGAHPAFRWPLRDGIAKEAHTLAFSAPEPAPIRRLTGGLLRPDPLPSPIEGQMLLLTESLFTDDAMILDHPASQSVRFSAPGAPGIDVSWEGFSELGLWMKPGAAFLCIEPWCGYASPVGFDGDFAEKPGLLLIPPGEQRSATHRMRLLS